MTLERPTQQHLVKARGNRDVADALVGPAARGVIDPPAPEWAVVAAFYAAVHFVNAYCGRSCGASRAPVGSVPTWWRWSATLLDQHPWGGPPQLAAVRVTLWYDPIMALAESYP